MEKIRQDKILNVPNALTMLRFALMPFFVWQFFSGHMAAALGIYVTVQLTDMLDGLIARRFHLVTNFEEALLVAGGAVALHRGIVVHAKHIGKVATVAFALAIVLSFLSAQPWDRIAMGLAVVLTLGALVFYTADMLGPLRAAKRK